MRQSFGKSEQVFGKREHLFAKPAHVFAFDHPGVQAFFAARYPVKTAQAVAAAVGVSPRTVEKWLDGTASPNFTATCRLVAAYGPEFLAICLPAADWLSAAARAARSRRIQAQMDTLAADLATLEAK